MRWVRYVGVGYVILSSFAAQGELGAQDPIPVIGNWKVDCQKVDLPLCKALQAATQKLEVGTPEHAEASQNSAFTKSTKGGTGR